MSDLREKFLNAKPTKSEILEYPEIGLKVKVRGLSYQARTTLLKDAMISDTQLDMVKMVPRAIIATFTDPLNDQPIFTEADNDVILSLDDSVIEKARAVIWRVLGLSPEDVEKNSDKTKASAPSSV